MDQPLTVKRNEQGTVVSFTVEKQMGGIFGGTLEDVMKLFKNAGVTEKILIPFPCDMRRTPLDCISFQLQAGQFEVICDCNCIELPEAAINYITLEEQWRLPAGTAKLFLTK